MNYDQYVAAITGVTNKFRNSNPELYIKLSVRDDGVAIHVEELENARNNWIQDKLEEMRDFISDSGYNIVVNDPKRKILVVNFFDGWGEVYPGVARCAPTDEYDFNVGMAVAFAKAMRKSIPDFI